MKKREKNKNLFNLIFYSIVITILSLVFIYDNALITSSMSAYNAIRYYEDFEKNIDLYEKLDFSNQLFIPKEYRYNNVKKNLLNGIQISKEEGEKYYLDELYDKYGETALKAYYETFTVPMFSSVISTSEKVLYFIFVIVVIILIYKRFSLKGALIASAVIFLGSILFLIDTNRDISLIITLLIIALINVSINYFVFDKKQLKKS